MTDTSSKILTYLGEYDSGGSVSQEAEPFRDGGKAQYYYTAANWLTKARTAFRNMGSEEEWRKYLAGLLERYRLKHKLVPLLEGLRR